MASVPSYSAPSASSGGSSLTRNVFETDLSTGEIRALVQVVDQSVVPATVSYIDPDTAAARVPTGQISGSPLRVVNGSQELITVAVGPTAGQLAAPTFANSAEIHVWDASGIVFTTNGTDPSLTLGTRVSGGATFKLEGSSEIANFKVFSLGISANPGLSVEFQNFGSSESFAD